MRLAIYGLSGAGKSTTARLLRDTVREQGRAARVVKLATPLYELQEQVYTRAGCPVQAGQQDQQLLRDLAGHLRRINPTALVDRFLEDVAGSSVEVVLNDDLKDTTTDYPRLVAAGFRFLHVTCAEPVRLRRLAGRGDLTHATETLGTWRFDRIRPDWTLDNTLHDTAHLLRAVRTLVDDLPAERALP